MYVPHERIIAYSLSDVNNSLVGDSDAYPDLIRSGSDTKDKNYKQRIFLLTTQGIQILEPVKKKWKCTKCKEYEFCPRGPKQDFVIHFEEIDTIVRFPNIPQKLLIKYHKNEGKFLTHYQLNLNFPGLTEQESIYYNLVPMLQEKRWEMEQKGLKQPSDFTLLTNYTDLYMKNDLKYLLKYLSKDEVSKYKVNSIKMIIASIQKNDVVNQQFFN